MKHRLAVSVYLAGLLFLFFLPDGLSKGWFILIWTLLFLGIVAFGVVDMKANYFTRSVSRLQSPQVLLSFDDGPDPVNTPRILDILKKYDARAVFFVIGKKAQAHPDIMSRIISEGHLLGNHTYSHPLHFALLSTRQVREEIVACELVLQSYGAHAGLFRPPVGHTNPRIARVIRELGLTLVGWSVRSLDSVNPSHPDAIQRRVLHNLRAGSIVLFHDNLPQTAAMLEPFLSAAILNGATFVSGDSIEYLKNEIGR